MVFFPVYDPVYPLFLDVHQALDLGSTLSQYDTILTNCFYKDSIFKWDYIQKF